LPAFAARTLARFAASFLLTAADSFRFDAIVAVPPFCPAWNAAQRFRGRC
jgi:hypothetical protein